MTDDLPPWRYSKTGQLLSEACLDCGAVMKGLYCTECGQKNQELHQSLWRVLKDAFSATIILDNKLWRTLRRLFFEPGALAAEYAHGRRTSTIKPFRLYFVVSVLFFAALAFDPNEYAFWSEPTHTKVELPFKVMVDDEPNKDSPQWMKPFIKKAKANKDLVEEHPEWLMKQLTQRLPKAAFFMVPVLALILKVLWRKRVFTEHLVLALNVQTIAFSLLGLSLLPLDAPGPLLAVLGVIFLAWFVASLRRFYGEGGGRTLIKAMPVLLLYVTVLSMAFLVTIMLSMLADR